MPTPLAVENLFAKALLRAPVEPFYAIASRSSSPVIDGKRLDGKTRYILSLMSLVGPPPPETLSPVEARAEFLRRGEAAAPPRRRLARVTDVEIPSAAGAIRARVYVPFAKARALPALVYFHGGGWVLGCIETHDRLCRVIADDAACIVVSVDYRLAPECKYPAAVIDARAAFTWVAEQAASLGIDSSRIAVGGDSAGGNLAAVTTLAGVAGQCPLPAYQLLIYPVTDLACDTTSYENFAVGYFLTRSLMLWYRDHYLPEAGAYVEPQASPLRAELRRPLPPALVITAGFDPLLDEGLAYAHKMRAAGTEVTYRCHEGLIHGFVNMTGAIPAARYALAEATTALRLAFARI
jgi:acetyl esterase